MVARGLLTGNHQIWTAVKVIADGGKAWWLEGY